ncbi:MAG: class I SAM-dependent methyltransferase [Chloroflexi bacterium]|nr:class I SAM-dependent methyltransferase [Chloroflexota bacterium]
MDEIARFNKERWEELAMAGIEYSRPFLNLDEVSARNVIDVEGRLGDVKDKEALCLAAGGGQQSAAFGLMGAKVTVLDLSETQLERDREAANHYGLEIETYQGDMRDLSRFAPDSFDIVWQAHSINFVPDVREVFRQVARVLKENGIYRLHCTNPFTHSIIDDKWNGKGYELKDAYVDGEIKYPDPHWDVKGYDGENHRIVGPREFRHTLSTLVNGLIENGFTLNGLWEDTSDQPNPEPGSWEHFKSVAAPWITFLSTYRPDSIQ